MKFKRIAIASAISASLFTTTMAEAHVSYHMSDAGLDVHWRNNGTLRGLWTGGSPIDKGYVAGLPITWLANIHDNDKNYEVSAADAIAEGEFILALNDVFGGFSDFTTFEPQDVNYQNTTIKVVSNVPVPAAVWFFASGLGILCFRKKNVNKTYFRVPLFKL